MRSINVTQAMRDHLYDNIRAATAKKIKKASLVAITELLSDIIDSTAVQNLLKCRFIHTVSYMELSSLVNYDSELGYLSVCFADLIASNGKLGGIKALPRATSNFTIIGKYSKNSYVLNLNNYGTAKIIDNVIINKATDYVGKLKSISESFNEEVKRLKEFKRGRRKFKYTKPLLKEYPEYKTAVETLFGPRFINADKKSKIYSDNRKMQLKLNIKEKEQLNRKKKKIEAQLNDDVEVEDSAKEIAIAIAKATLLTV